MEEQDSKDKKDIEILGISLVLVRNPKDGKYLSVLENNNTWWLPGGRVDAPQFWSQGAIRQCQQEAGVDINIKGILRFQSVSSRNGFLRIKIVFYGEPKDPNQPPKNKPDHQSLGAKYMSLEEIVACKAQWRGPELYNWASYVQKGGKIFPTQLLSQINTK